MEKEKLVIMIVDFIRDVKENGSFDPASEAGVRYLDILFNSRKLLPDNQVYISGLIGAYNKEQNERYPMSFKVNGVVASLEYILKLLNLMIPENISPRKILDDSQDKLKEAGVSFEQEDYSSVINKLNTAVELALKDELDIPRTITKINTRKILDICISNDLGPKEYLPEIVKHILEVDNRIKHSGYKPQKIDAINAIAAFEEFIKKVKKYPFNTSKEIRDKIFSGI